MNYVILDTTVCNCKFYEEQNSLKDNAVVVENLSGRVVSYLANERFIKVKEMKLTLSNTASNNEYSRFMSWYTSTLGGIAGNFKCAALGSAIWRFRENPSEDSGQAFKTITMSIEEVLQ